VGSCWVGTEPRVGPEHAEEVRDGDARRVTPQVKAAADESWSGCIALKTSEQIEGVRRLLRDRNLQRDDKDQIRLESGRP
jgi:hypothetical protein